MNPNPVAGLLKVKVSSQLSLVAIQGLVALPKGLLYQLCTSSQLPAEIFGENDAEYPVLETLALWLYPVKSSSVQPAGVDWFSVELELYENDGAAKASGAKLKAEMESVAKSPRIQRLTFRTPPCTMIPDPLGDMAEKYFCGPVTECSDSGFGVGSPQKSPLSG